MQDILVFIIVAVAAGYLLRRQFGKKPSGGCGGCGGSCAGSTTSPKGGIGSTPTNRVSPPSGCCQGNGSGTDSCNCGCSK